MPPLDPRYPPLSTDQLRAIWKRSPSPTVRLLLWEIYRLRLVAINAHSYVKLAVYRGERKGMDTTLAILFDGLQRALEEEPVIQESQARQAKLTPK